MNWYKKYKFAWNRGIPLMESLDEKIKNKMEPYKEDPKSLVHLAPYFGGEKRKGYPKNISFTEKEEGSKLQTIPTDETNIDAEVQFGEGAGAGDKGERFSDDEDKLVSFDKKPDPIGPHNMQEMNFYNRVSRKPRLKNINRL